MMVRILDCLVNCKESDGYTPEYVRAVSARKNIAEGTDLRLMLPLYLN